MTYSVSPFLPSDKDYKMENKTESINTFDEDLDPEIPVQSNTLIILIACVFIGWRNGKLTKYFDIQGILGKTSFRKDESFI